MGIVRQFDKSNFQNFIGGVQVGESVSREGISVFWLFGQEPSQQLNVATIEEPHLRQDSYTISPLVLSPAKSYGRPLNNHRRLDAFSPDGIK